MDKKKILDKEFVKLQESVKRKKIEGNITDRFVHLAYIKAWQLQRDKTNILIKKMGERKGNIREEGLHGDGGSVDRRLESAG